MGGQFSETKPLQNRSLCGNGPLQNVGIDLTPKSGRLRNGSRRKFTGQSLLLTFSVPQFLFFTSRRPMTSCAIAASISPRRTFWERRIERHKTDWSRLIGSRPIELYLAGVFADQIRRGGSSGHFALEVLKSLPGLAFAIVNELDGGITGQWPADDRHGILADRLIHIILVMTVAADRPFESDRCNRARTDLLITTGLDQFGGDRLFLDCGFFRLAMEQRLIEDAGDSRERMISRVAFTHNLSLQITQYTGTEASLSSVRFHSSPRMRLSFVASGANGRQLVLPGPLLLELGRQAE